MRSLLARSSALFLFGIATMACSDSSPTSPAPVADSGVPIYGPLGEQPDLPVGERMAIEHLSAPVDIVRDKDGRPHIYASTVTDAMRVEGYLLAQDRTLQLELLRRTAEGRLAEIFGAFDPDTIDSDIALRTVGLGRVAKTEYEQLPAGEAKDMLDAYADGITQLFRKIRAGDVPLPPGMFGVPVEAFTDWNGIDSLAIAKLQTYLLSYDSNFPLVLESVLGAAQGAFVPGAASPLFAKRAGFERDFLRFAPPAPAFTAAGYPGANASSNTKPRSQPRARLPGRNAGAPATAEPRTARNLITAAAGYRAAVRKANQAFAPDGFGSNSWAISPARSATGHVLLASDPHLALSAPAVFWPVSIEVHKDAGLNVSGIAFPGIPGIILGHNEHIAWGATVALYQTTDVYAETLTANGSAVSFDNGTVALQTIEETISIAGGAPYVYHVKVVPHHGPILPTIENHRVRDPDPAIGALSAKWTGLSPSENFVAITKLLRARSAEEGRTALNQFTVGAQNWVLGDTAGNILWTSHVRIPTRSRKAFTWDPATYKGHLPIFVLPGDGSAEWTGYLADDLVPWARNPASGYLISANNDPIGDTADNDPSNGNLPDGTPAYLGAMYDSGFRAARIQELIESHRGPLSPEDFAVIQADVRSNLGARLTSEILRAIDSAEDERSHPGTHPDLASTVKDPAYVPNRIAAVRDILRAWAEEGDYTAASGMDPDANQPFSDQGTSPQAKAARASRATLIFNVWLTRLLDRTFGDELGALAVSDSFFVMKIKSLLHLLSTEPSKLATYDSATGDSAVWDDMATPAIESRQERILRSLLDGLAWLESSGGHEMGAYRWGKFHTVRFDPLVPLFRELAIPQGSDALFPNGFPRSGDLFAVDAADYAYDYAPGTVPSLAYGAGPAQRFVVSLDPSGPRAWNAIPGGTVWQSESPHFRDQADLWRKNQTHAVPFALAEVIAAKESRTVAAARLR